MKKNNVYALLFSVFTAFGMRQKDVLSVIKEQSENNSEITGHFADSQINASKLDLDIKNNSEEQDFSFLDNINFSVIKQNFNNQEKIMENIKEKILKKKSPKMIKVILKLF